MEDEKIFFDDIDCLDESFDGKERNKAKNKRINFTISEIKTVLNYYEKCGHLRNTTEYFNIPTSTLVGWIKKNEYLSDKRKISN